MKWFTDLFKLKPRRHYVQSNEDLLALQKKSDAEAKEWINLRERSEIQIIYESSSETFADRIAIVPLKDVDRYMYLTRAKDAANFDLKVNRAEEGTVQIVSIWSPDQ